MSRTVPVTEVVASIVERYANDHGTSLEEAVTILVLKGMDADSQAIQHPGTFRPFPRDHTRPQYSSEDVYAFLDDEELRHDTCWT